MDVSRITRGNISLRKQPTDFREIIQHALETTELPHLPVWVEADEIRLCQVVTNLLNNAAKYTDDGGHIFLRLESCKDEAVLCVRERGIGTGRKLAKTRCCHRTKVIVPPRLPRSAWIAPSPGIPLMLAAHDTKWSSFYITRTSQT